MPRIAHPAEPLIPLELTPVPATGPLFQGADIERLRTVARMSVASPRLDIGETLQLPAPTSPAALGVQRWRVEQGWLLLNDETLADVCAEDAELERLGGEWDIALKHASSEFDAMLSMMAFARDAGLGDGDEDFWHQLTADSGQADAAQEALWSQMDTIRERQRRRDDILRYRQAQWMLWWVRLWSRVGAPGAAAAQPEPPANEQQDPDHSVRGYRAKVVLTRGGKRWEATVPALPGVVGRGRSAAGAVRQLNGAIPGYLAALEATGQPVPTPDWTTQETGDGR